MDLSKLDQISTNGLLKIQAHVGQILQERKVDMVEHQRKSLRIGGRAQFADAHGVIRRMVVTRINGKSASGYDLDVYEAKGVQSKWRVALSLLTPLDPISKPRTSMTPRLTDADRPATAMGGNW